jgi:two-component system nitrogen regulation response regulator NtrX
MIDTLSRNENEVLPMMKTIMIVCDERNSLSSLDGMLARFGYKTIVAGDNEAAFALIRDGDPVDLVVIDLVLLGRDGLEFLSRVRRVNPQLPCVMIAGNCSIEAYLKAISLGVYDYLNKPVSSREIIKVIAAALKSPQNSIALRGLGDDSCPVDPRGQYWKRAS